MRVAGLQKRLAQDVSVVYERIASVFPVTYEPRRFHVETWVKKLSEATAPIGVHHELEWDITQATQQLGTSGIWYPKTELPANRSMADVRLIWYCNPTNRTVKLSKKQWHVRRFYCFSMMMHELIHRYQDEANVTPRVYRAQTDMVKERDQQWYYGSTDEIETNGFQTAMECLIWWPTDTLQSALQNALTYPNATYARYWKTFAGCRSHPAVRHYRRKIEQWYDVMTQNRAFYDSLELVSM